MSVLWNRSTKNGRGCENGSRKWKRKSKGRDVLACYIFVRCLLPAVISNWRSHSELERVFAQTSCFLGQPGVLERNPSSPLAVVTGRKAAMTAGDLLWWRRPVELDKLPGVESVIQLLMQQKMREGESEASRWKARADGAGLWWQCVFLQPAWPVNLHLRLMIIIEVMSF